jgi:hypothetical protein
LKRDPHAPTSCTLVQNPSAADIVQHVNGNVSKITAWRANRVKITARTGGMTVPLSGHFYVERDHRLRLEVTSIAGKEVDFGSNDEIFWLWSKRMAGPEGAPVFFASHDDLDLAQQKFPVPFEPQWLMEALSIAPLKEDGLRLEGEPGNGELRLVSDHTLPSGQEVRKVLHIDACHGRVLEHSTLTKDGKPLVRVRMGDHRLDPTSGALLPRYVKLDWPQQDMSMEMALGNVEVNPPTIAATVWQMPQIPGAQMVNLGGPPGRRRTQIAQSNATGTLATGTTASGHQSRAALVYPSEIESLDRHRTADANPSDVMPDDIFELPQIGQPTSGVELDEPEFSLPEDEPVGRAQLTVPGALEVEPH